MTLFQMLSRSAAKDLSAPALAHRDNTIRYGELIHACEGFAGGLSALGIGKDSRVALMLPNCIPFAVAYFGASGVGATVVPMNVLYRPDEARYILEDSGAEVLVAVEAFRPLIQAIRPALPDLKHVVIVAESGVAADEIDFRDLCAHAPAPAMEVDADDVAVILYTSGTTGRPKGAMLTHRNLISNAVSCTAALLVTENDCFLSALPLFHAFAAMVFLVLPILMGARVQLMDRFVPATTLNLMEQSDATVFGGVPSMFGLMLQIPRGSRPELARLRLCISGGAPLPPEVGRAFEEAYETSMVEGYGLTEASPVVAVNPPRGVRKFGSIGLPIVGVEVKIVDDENRPVEPGAIGELAIRGENVMKGYLHRPDETAEAIRDGWLHTGDLTRQDEDGYLYVVGRKSELIIVGGLNVYPGEVERVLVEHPAVLEAAAFGVPDPSRGEAVRAAVVLRPGIDATEKELRTFCRKRLASFKAPRAIEIRDELPKNALGKVMRHALREEFVAAAG